MFDASDLFRASREPHEAGSDPIFKHLSAIPNFREASGSRVGKLWVEIKLLASGDRRFLGSSKLKLLLDGQISQATAAPVLT